MFNGLGFFLTSNIVWLVEVPVLLRVQYCTKVLTERGQFGFMNCVDNVVGQSEEIQMLRFEALAIRQKKSKFFALTKG